MAALEEAITAHRHGDRVPHAEAHNRVKTMYTWQNVAHRTEKVYSMYMYILTQTVREREGREGKREGGREGREEGKGREGEREFNLVLIFLIVLVLQRSSKFLFKPHPLPTYTCLYYSRYMTWLPAFQIEH